MKTLSIALLGALLGAALLLQLQRGRGPAVPPGKDLDSVLKAWEASTGGEGRQAVFVLDDAGQRRDPFESPKEPSALDRMEAKARRVLGLGGGAPSLLGQALLDQPDTVYRRYDPLFDQGEDAFVRSLANDILRAQQAGAQVDIVAQGRAGEAALKAVKLLEGDEAKPGVPLRSLVAIGLDEERLQKRDPGTFKEFKRPRNLQQWANLWKDRSGMSLVTTFYTPEASGGGTIDYQYLSQPTQQALLQTADVRAFEQAVVELGKMLAAFRVRGGAWPKMVVVSMKTPLFAEPPKALEPPQRVFRDIYGNMSGAKTTTPQTGGRAGGYGYETPAAPDMKALQPKREAPPQKPPQASRPASRPAVANDNDIPVKRVFKCRGEDCPEGMPERIRVLGYLSARSRSDYSLCESPDRRSPGNCIRVLSNCVVEDGAYGIVGRSYAFFRSADVFVSDCRDFQPLR